PADGGPVLRARLEVDTRQGVSRRGGPHRRAAVLVRVLPPGAAARVPGEAVLRRGTQYGDHQPPVRQHRVDPPFPVRAPLLDRPASERPRGDRLTLRPRVPRRALLDGQRRDRAHLLARVQALQAVLHPVRLPHASPPGAARRARRPPVRPFPRKVRGPRELPRPGRLPLLRLLQHRVAPRRGPPPLRRARHEPPPSVLAGVRERPPAAAVVAPPDPSPGRGCPGALADRAAGHSGGDRCGGSGGGRGKPGGGSGEGELAGGTAVRSSADRLPLRAGEHPAA
ncbi:unnamed protein product, partial [Ectocarpus sp. 13 AM-2016]